jgi:hypothetical protein
MVEVFDAEAALDLGAHRACARGQDGFDLLPPESSAVVAAAPFIARKGGVGVSLLTKA